MIIKKRARIKIQPRFKIQYPMKNQDKDMQVFDFYYTLNGVFLNW